MDSTLRPSSVEAPGAPDPVSYLPKAFLNDPMRTSVLSKRKALDGTEYDGITNHYGNITSKRSRIGIIDLESFLRDDETWNCLTASQQKAIIEHMGIISKVPSALDIQANGKYQNVFTLADGPYMDLEKVVERYQRRVKVGGFDPEWQEEAAECIIRRGRGEYPSSDEEESDKEDEESGVEESESSDDGSDGIDERSLEHLGAMDTMAPDGDVHSIAKEEGPQSITNGVASQPRNNDVDQD